MVKDADGSIWSLKAYKACEFSNTDDVGMCGRGTMTGSKIDEDSMLTQATKLSLGLVRKQQHHVSR